MVKSFITALLVVLLVMLPFQNLRAQESPPPQPQHVVACVVSVVVIIGGLYIAYELKKFCDEHLPPPNPVPPPPPTNAPPSVPSTNHAHTSSINAGNSGARLHDIYGAKLFAPDNTEYELLMVWPLETSTNLVNWSSLNITAYISPTFVLIQCGDNVSLQPRSDSWGVALPDAPCRFFRVPAP